MNNYPPGVTGNEPQICGDESWDNLYDKVAYDCAEHNLTAEEAEKIWKEGLKEYLLAKWVERTTKGERRWKEQ